MNSIHDMGGMHGFGAIERDHDDAPVFDAEWEKRIAGILACAAFNGLSVFDENRRAAEMMSAQDYLTTPYFGRWLHMIETMVLEKGVATAHELRSGQCAADGRQWPAMVSARHSPRAGMACVSGRWFGASGGGCASALRARR